MPGFGPVGSAPIGGSATGASQSSISAIAAGAVLVAAATIAAGTATGTTAGTAPGATLTGTSSIAAGSATGTAAGTAPGASLHGTSTIAAGTASGTVSANATAPGAALTGTSSIRAGAASGAIGGGTQQNTLTVPSSRIAVFAGRQRVVVFSGKAPVGVAKGSLDELWYVGDFTKDCGDSATSAASVTYVSAGVAVLVAPTLQGNLGVVKLGALDPAGGTFTFRVTCDNGEQFDRTIVLTVLDDRTHVFGKDPDDRRLYTFDFSADCALGTTSLASAQAPVVAGVTALSTATIQGNRAVVMIGGLADGENSCELTVLLANAEKLVRSIYFTAEPH